jgi:hypothetical protein
MRAESSTLATADRLRLDATFSRMASLIGVSSNETLEPSQHVSQTVPKLCAMPEELDRCDAPDIPRLADSLLQHRHTGFVKGAGCLPPVLPAKLNHHLTRLRQDNG